jgi:hypothetical protein
MSLLYFSSTCTSCWRWNVTTHHYWNLFGYFSIMPFQTTRFPLTWLPSASGAIIIKPFCEFRCVVLVPLVSTFEKVGQHGVARVDTLTGSECWLNRGRNLTRAFVRLVYSSNSRSCGKYAVTIISLPKRMDAEMMW